MSEPKILYFDLESMGVNALRSDLGVVFCLGYKWHGERSAHVLTLTQKEIRDFNDRRLLKEASKLIEEADLLVGHFASVFDRRFIQGRLIINNLPPIPNTKLRDTCLIARSAANFSSNRLKHLAKVLNMRHQKLENDWPTAWFEVMKGNMKVLNELAEYCKGDVLAVEELYLRLRPFDNAHVRLYEDREKCRVCGGTVQLRGTCFVGEHRYQRWQCTKCGKWDRSRKALKDIIDSEE